MVTEIFSDTSFWTAFRKDLKLAKRHLIIQSPFVSSQRLRILAPDFHRLCQSNVLVCTFIQQPRYWNTAYEKLSVEDQYEKHQLNAQIELLKSWNFHVNLRPKIHSKFAIVDNQILWEGSLNIFSHGTGIEHMRRWDDTREVSEVMAQHSLLDCQSCVEIIEQFTPGYPSSTLDSKPFGAWIKRNRLQAQLKYSKLVSLSGVSRRTIVEIENGSGCTLKTADSLIEQLGSKRCLIPNHLLPVVAHLLHKEMQADTHHQFTGKTKDHQ